MLDKTLLQSLENVGFDEKESAAYLALLELGEAKATEIADKAGLKRAIIYHVMDRLKNKGYVFEPMQKGVKCFAPADPTKIFKNAKSAVDEFKFMLPLMRAMQVKSEDKPRIEFYEGIDGVLSVYRMYNHAKQARFLTSIKRLSQLIPEEVDVWVKHAEMGLFKGGSWHLVPNTATDLSWGKKVAKAGQNVRKLPKGIDCEMDFAIIDDKLGITSFDPFFVVLIHSEGIARSAATLFDLAWKQGKPIK
jgi:predicted transcriptional regulator